MQPSLDSISFDEEDRLIFQVDDPRLRADALRYSILPKMAVVLREALAKIKEVYEVAALDDSTIFRSPNFRTKRSTNLRVNYHSAAIGLGGNRQRNKWVGISRTDGKEVQIVPFLNLFELTKYGITIWFNSSWIKGISSNFYKVLFDFLLDNEPIIHRLNYLSRMRPLLLSGDGCDPVSTLREHYCYMRESESRCANFSSVLPMPYPIVKINIAAVVMCYTSFFPIYDSFLQLAMGKQPRLTELVAKLNWWIKEVFNKKVSEQAEQLQSGEKIEFDGEEIDLKSKITVRPSFRWQVFTRDNWRCVACGRSGTEGVILQVDHIVPRSKGGQNHLDNYQTLCTECNQGKSNRDNTDFRAGVRDGS